MVNIPKVNVACQCANSGTRVIYMSSSSPPHPWKRGKGGDTPHPAKGLPPLGTLLCSTFKGEKVGNGSPPGFLAPHPAKGLPCRVPQTLCPLEPCFAQPLNSPETQGWALKSP